MVDIGELAARRTPGHGLPGEFYTDPGVFAADQEAVFGGHWIFVGSEPEVPEPGDYLTVQVGRSPLIVLREDDGGLRAFHNVCRHRGSRLLAERCGTVGNLVCPYHHWTYSGSDGRLLHADAEPPGFDRSRFGLARAHVRSVGGLIFVCTADEPPADIEELAERIEPYLAPHDVAGLKVAAQIDLVEDGDWKLVMENNRECYHCDGHPELGRSLFPTVNYTAEQAGAGRGAAFERYRLAEKEMTARWDADGLPHRRISRLTGTPTGYFLERVPLDGSGESLTLDTRAASQKLLGSFSSPKQGRLSLHTQPNSWHHFMSDHVVTFAALPVAPERTLVRSTWLVHADAVEGLDYRREELVGVWRATNEQDAEFVTGVQAGVRSPAYVPGPLSPTESWVDDFITWYLERLTV